ncbi:hypothetical protein SAY87_027309 [Trapa incisa]|uniref:WAT1-related protein n=1 Tax=Trapa incisa TaxID=236973 RepID=A0AAN7JMA4_9MYRT|nr:hypothetical protein SAY87_027309 [Trapa incisa]
MAPPTVTTVPTSLAWHLTFFISNSILCPGACHTEKGPVFVTAFSPLMMIIVAIMGSFILAEKIYFGGVLGAVLIVVGHSVLWGKYKEHAEKAPEEILPDQTVKGSEPDSNDNVQMQQNRTMASQMVAVHVAIPLNNLKWQLSKTKLINIC